MSDELTESIKRLKVYGDELIAERDTLRQQLSAAQAELGKLDNDNVGLREKLSAAQAQAEAMKKRLEVAKETIGQIRQLHRPLKVEGQSCTMCNVLINYYDTIIALEEGER